MAIHWQLPGYADDVAASAAGGRLWIAASTATLATEHVWFGEVREGVVRDAVALDDGPCCRPAIAALDDGSALVVACAADRLVAAYAAGGELVRWQLAIDGRPLHVAAAAAGASAWLAIEIARGRERYVRVVEVVPATGAVTAAHTLGGAATWCRWPVLATGAAGELAVAWAEGPARARGVIRIARPARLDQTVDVAVGEAPALGFVNGAVAVAWHHNGAAAGGDDREASVVRAIELAIVAPDGTLTALLPPPGAGGRIPQGEDQGWELPALALGPDGTLWLAGRSTHGHHVTCRRIDGAWTAPRACDGGGWGGRGRRHALVVHAGEVWFARRAPDGVVVETPTAGELAPSYGPRTTAARRSAQRTVPGVLFGDLHQHTAHSDGCGTLEELWIAARDARGLDFAAITDHDQFCRRALGPATWQIATSTAAAFDDPGRFVAIAGYEFTGPRHPGPGHKCVYFGDRVPERVPDRDVDALFAVVRELGAIAVPHHVAWTGADFAHHDPAIQPVWEICSVHGCYEGEGACAAHPPRADYVIPGHFVRDALAAGLRFGFIGSTDSHGLDWHHGIARWRNPFRSGLAGVVGAQPTRDGILGALRARRTYATTGAKIGVRVELDGAQLGSELPAGTRGELIVEVAGTAPITALVLVEPTGERALAIEERGGLACARTTVAPPDTGAHYLYIRVEQSDGELAWTSPFFIGP